MNKPTDPCVEQQHVFLGMRDLVGFAASGGGYRATLFHLGGLIRINELGWLRKVDRFSGVSGGSITLGALAAAWTKLRFENDRATNFDALVTRPLLALTNRRVDVWASIYGLIPGLESAGLMSRFYRALVGRMLLSDLPDHPQFVFNATNMQTGVTMRMTKRYLRDYRAGCLAHPRIEVALAIAASSAFPPFLSPNVVRLPSPGLRPTGDPALADERFRTRLVLTDGGVYDNLGLQTLSSFRTIIASDGGSPGKVDPAPNPLLQLMRVMAVMSEQTRALRRAELVNDFKQKTRQGAIWTIKTDIRSVGRSLEPPALSVHPTQIASLATVATRLWPFGTSTTRRLLNWGYALADAEMRTWLGATGPAPRWPFPDHGLERTTDEPVGRVASDGIDQEVTTASSPR
jgi:NTE family protein